MNIFTKSIGFALLLLFTLLTQTACMSKQANGKYASKYSFHPYYDMYPNKMSGTKTSYKVNNSVAKRSSTPSHKVAYNDENRYPSNMPSDNY